MGCKGKKKGRLWAMILTGVMIFSSIAAYANETESPVQEVEVTNSYLTKAHIKTNSKTQIQTIKIEKSFLVWVTVQKGKDKTPTTDNTK